MSALAGVTQCVHSCYSMAIEMPADVASRDLAPMQCICLVPIMRVSCLGLLLHTLGAVRSCD